MNTHQKVFFTCAVSLGLVAAAFSATPAPAVKVAVVELPRITVVGHRMAPEVALEQALVLGHRSDVMLASNSSNKASVG
jgi:hypothetical protein